MNEVTFKGKMEFQEQDSGYFSPKLTIGDTDITRTIEHIFAGGTNLFALEGEWELILRKPVE